MLRVVIIEDENFLRNEIVLTTPWENFNCIVVGEAQNGIDGVALINKLSPDIVITDIRMPGMDGIELLKQTQPPASIILTGYSDFEYAKAAIRLGVKDYILKPIDDEEFYSALDRITKTLMNNKKEETGKKLEVLIDTPIGRFVEHITESDKDIKSYYIQKALQYIKKNLAKDLSVKDVAEKLQISESYLSKLFKEKTNYTFINYLNSCRISRVLELLTDKNIKVGDAAHASGFRDMSYFCQIFKKYVGVTPGKFRQGLNE